MCYNLKLILMENIIVSLADFNETYTCYNTHKIQTLCKLIKYVSNAT